MTGVVLRPYQNDVLSDLKFGIDQGARSPCLQMPTGSGKSPVGARLAKYWVQMGGTVWTLVHRRELAKQWLSHLQNDGVPAIDGSAGISSFNALVWGVALLRGRLDTMPMPDPDKLLIITDEGHHAPAPTYQAVYDASQPRINLLLTATPARTDGKGLAPTADYLVEGPDVASLIAVGALSDYEILSLPGGPDTTGIRRSKGDWVKGQLAERCQTVTANVVGAWKRYARGRNNLVFAVNRDHGRKLASELSNAGGDVRYVDGTTPERQRDIIMDGFKAGEFTELVTVDLIGEGFDCEGADCAILARPTQSVVVHLQQIGRTLRPGLRKALIVDTVGNTNRLGGPRTPRRWSLDGRVESDLSEGDKPFEGGILCEKCGTRSPSGSTQCVACGKAFAKGGSKREIDTKLVTIDELSIEIKGNGNGGWDRRSVQKAMRRCRNWSDLRRLAQQLGYSRRWAELQAEYRPHLAESADVMNGGRR